MPGETLWKARLPEPSAARRNIPFPARVWRAEKLIVLVAGSATSLGKTRRRPEPLGLIAMTFALTDVAVSGTPQFSVIVKCLTSPGAIDGPPRGPAGRRVSRTRHGVTLKKVEAD